MIIIGEKINGAIPSVSRAIAAHDEEFLKNLAKRQADAGADFIDCCVGAGADEPETMAWLIGLIQSVCDTPIALDSPDPQVLLDAMKLCKKPGLINSVSGEGNKIELLFPAVADTDWQVMALLCDDSGIPKSAADRIHVLDRVMASAAEYGISQSRLHIDPLVEMLCTSEEGIAVQREVIRYTRAHYPEAHISGGLSNISYNLPYRRIINLAFAVMCIAEGMDSAVLDPLNRDLRGAIYAAEALKGDDYYCLEYINAFRAGLFGPEKA